MCLPQNSMFGNFYVMKSCKIAYLKKKFLLLFVEAIFFWSKILNVLRHLSSSLQSFDIFHQTSRIFSELTFVSARSLGFIFKASFWRENCPFLDLRGLPQPLKSPLKVKGTFSELELFGNTLKAQKLS